jgi:hypothetical protein
MATAGSKGLACVFVSLHRYLLKTKYFSYAYKNHDSHAAGGDEQASLIWQPVACNRLKRMEAE